MTRRILSDMRLKQILNNYLFVSKPSPMVSVVNKIVAARTTKQEVELSGFAGSTMADVERVLSALAIPFTHTTDEASGGQMTRRGNEHRSVNSIRIPRFFERPFDLEFLVPFYLQVFNAQFSKGDKAKVEKVDVLFIPYLYNHLSQFRDLELTQFIQNAAESAEDGTITIDSMLSATYTSLNDLYSHVMSLGGHALTYLGIDYWFDDLEVPSNVLDHPLNEPLAGLRIALQSQLNEYDSTGKLGAICGLPDFIVVDAVKLFDLADIGIAARNIAFWNKFKGESEESVLKCLKLRNSGKTETEIESALGFENSDSCQDWLLNNHLEIESGHDLDVYERWLVAQDELFGGPVDVVRIPAQPLQTDDLKAENEIAETRASSEFAKSAAPDHQANPPVLTIHTMSREVRLNGELVSLKDTKKYVRFEALRYLLDEYLKSGKPIESHKIVAHAVTQEDAMRRRSKKLGFPKVHDLFKSSEDILPLLVSGPHGHYSLDVDLKKSEVN